MEFPFSSALLTTFVHATEDESKVTGALRNILPREVKIQRRKLKGHHGNPILILSASIERRKILRELWDNLTARLGPEEFKKLGQIVQERLDNECNFYLRFDKQLACTGKLALTDAGDVVHLRLKVAAYPAKREVAARLVQEFIYKQRGD
jgi:hypothetical protein